MFIASIIVSGACALICSLFEENASYDYISIILYSAAFFAIPLVFSLIGIGIVELYRKRNYEIQKKGNRILSVITALILAALLGGGGQAVYSLDLPQWKKDKPEEVVKSSSADISILLDFSGSMASYKAKCRQATCDLIDAVDKDDYIQIILFAESILNDDPPLLKATDENKQKLKNIVNGPYNGIGTNFNEPLTYAYDTLTGKTSKSKNKAVIMLTDGDAPLNSSVYQDYISAKIPVYSICIDITLSNVEDLVVDSGGYSVPLEGDDIDNGELLNAFRNIYEDEIPREELDDVVSKTYLPMFYGGEELSFLRVLIRLLIFALYTVLCSWCMYYEIGKSTLITAAVTAAVATLITCFTGSCLTAIPIFVLAFWIALTGYYPSTYHE